MSIIKYFKYDIFFLVSKETMDWYRGSIPDAVGEAKRNNKLFLVYIEGEKCFTYYLPLPI